MQLDHVFGNRWPLLLVLWAALVLAGGPAWAGRYRLSVGQDQILLNGQPIKIIGLRCSNALISEQAANQLIDQLDTFKAYGVNTVSVFFMGSRFGDVKGYRPDASLDPACAGRMGRIIQAADQRGMIVLVGCLYWSTSRAKEDLGHWKQEDANRAVANTVRWLKEHDYRNVLVDVDNEGMAHDATGWSIAAMIDAAHAVDSSIMVAYNDSDPPPANADLLIHHSPKVPGKPWVQSEGTPNNAPGGYWGSYSKVQGLYNYINIGLYTPAMRQEQCRQTDVDITRYNGHICASTWLQCAPPHGPNHTPGGSGDKDAPGVRWWLEHVRDKHGGPWTPPPAIPPASASTYFPPPESQGGWRKLQAPDDIRRLAGMDPAKLEELRQWLLASDQRNFAAVVIRNGHIVLEVERGNSAVTDARRVASVSKAVCATVLAIASEQSRQGLTPRKMSFDDLAFDFIPWARPLSDPRKAKITVRQLLNHTSGLCPESTGAPNDGTWDYILGHSGDRRTATLAFDPGTGCGYSTHALAHAALVCETVTGKPYDQFAIEALFRPLGIEHWWFQYYEGPARYGRHPSQHMGMPARDLARLAYCMLRQGRWKDQQVIPGWFVEQTGASSHDVKSPELRWKLNPQVFSLGWERPALLSGEGGRSGAGIPPDARAKPGSGGQYVAFVPSLDLVLTRQTGGSGDWLYEEYLRRACAAILQDPPQTHLSLRDGQWHLNGRITYPGTRAQGLLMNVRMVNSTFEDANKPAFDPDANTARFIARIPDYTAQGVAAFTLCLQGGMPGYEGAVNSAFNPDGSLRQPYLARVARVIRACDRHGAAVILGCYYQRQSKILRDEAAIRAGVVNVATWIRASGFRNVALEIANEYPHRGFAHPILRSPDGQAELINLARQTNPDLLVSSSGYGDGKLHEAVAQASDFLLIHFNGTPVPQIPARIAALRKFNKPIVCNEDDKVGLQAVGAAEACLAHGASWGLMLNTLNQYAPFEFNGAKDDAIVYARLRELTSRPAPPLAPQDAR